jgi:sugar phosphate isomerase/epimerase
MCNLGFFAYEEWLKHFEPRILETHLHDVNRHVDHYTSGWGTVNFKMVASYLPADALRIFELRVNNSAEQVKSGAQFLAMKGCIKKL